MNSDQVTELKREIFKIEEEWDDSKKALEGKISKYIISYIIIIIKKEKIINIW